MKLIISIIVLLLNLTPTVPKDSLSTVTEQKETLEQLQNEVKEIRRDQLNYKIEKDLLKETYSSNYSTIQLIISLILAIFAISGYIGIKGINNLKKEYGTELSKLKALKSEFEVKLSELTNSQQKVKEQIERIDQTNKEQSEKIKLLEIKEKASALMEKKAFQRALEYMTVGLELNNEDLELLESKALCLFKLQDYPEALKAYKKVLEIDPDNDSAILNLAELYLIAEQIENYDEFKKNNFDYLIVDSESNALKAYLDSLKYYLLDNTKELKKIILEFINKNDLSTNKNYVGNWQFSDLYVLLNEKSNTNSKKMLINFTNYLHGKMNGKALKKLIES